MNTRILFAADKLDKYGNIVGFLEHHGFPDIMKATNGDEVLKILRDNAPAIIILDVGLPVLDGFQMCKILKSAVFKQHENMAVVLLSDTYRTSMTSQLAKSAGAYGILYAPFKKEDLLLLINNKLYPEKVGAEKVNTFNCKAKVMIADDDPDIVRTMKTYLSQEGYKVFVAQDGKDTIQVIDDQKPNILFLDCSTPKSNGRNVLNWVRKTIPEMVVVVMTAHGSESMSLEFLKAGACDCITKPFDMKIIPEICEDALKRYNVNLINKHWEEGELRLNSMVEGMIDGVILMDTQGKPTLINKAGKDLLRFLDISVDANNSLVSINDINIREIYHEIFVKNQRYISSEIKTEGDEDRHFIVIASPVKASAGENMGVVIVLRDVTREYQLQSQLVKSERLYAVSNLVAGAAHELNNPLAGIQLCTELVINDPSMSEKAMKYLTRIQKETEQIQSVVKSLLTFTGNYTLSKEHVNINDIFEEIIKQKAYQFEHENIKIVNLLEEKLPALFVDSHQLRRVFLNIIENACISMVELQKERRLTIQTETCKNIVRISISDTGPGIPKEYLTKIFEPFFTKRQNKKNKGTGLGLSIAHSIIHQHNGKIYAKSESDAGATFVIELPIT